MEPISRRHLLAGSGLAAATWVAPSIIRIDVASALGSGVSSLSIKPFSVLDPCVTVSPLIEGTVVENVFGPFGEFDGSLTVSLTGLPPHTMVSVGSRICYDDTGASGWEGVLVSGNKGANTDCMDVLYGPNAMSLTSLPGFPTVPGPIDNMCVSYPAVSVANSGSTFVLEFAGAPTALTEFWGVACVDLTFS